MNISYNTRNPNDCDPCADVSTLVKSKHDKLNNTDNPNLNIAIINCQSVMAKKACFHNFIAEHNPDIIASCESYNWAKANWTQINDMAKSFCNNFIANYMVDTKVDVLWSIFKHFCLICLTCIPSKGTGKSHDHPWISPFIK